MSFKLTAHQKEGLVLLNDRDKTRILMTGGSRAGKTIVILYWMFQRAYQFPGCRQLICRKAAVDCRRAIWDDSIPKLLNMIIPSSEYVMQKSELKVSFNNGSEILLGSLDDQGSLERILGQEFTDCFINECTEMKFEAVQRIVTRLAQKVYDRDGKFYAVNKLIGDCNPTSPLSWVKKWFIDRVDPTTRPPKPLKDADKFASMHWTPYQNLENLPDGYIEQLDALPYEMRERMLNGNWVGGEGLILKEFKLEKHFIEPFKITSALEFI